MKSIKQFIIAGVCVAFCLFLFDSCRRDECYDGGPFNVKFSSVDLILKNNAGEYLYTEVNPLYNKDSLKITDESGHELEILSELRQASPGFWEFNTRTIYNPQTDAGAFNQELCKKFIIKYSFNESDTITTCYLAEKLACGSHLSYLKVFHRGVLAGEITDNLRATATIVKN